MEKLKVEDLLSLEEYAKQRDDFRARVMAHKGLRRVHIGPHLTLLFEDRLTIQYQVQEMLRTERIFESEGIKEELGVYNPLIPDGDNLKATMLIEYADVAERQRALARMRGIEERVWVRVAGFDPVHAIADEDLERTTGAKTSAVHFLRFQLSPEMIAAAREGAALSVGVDHPVYEHVTDPVAPDTGAALLADFD